MIAVVRGDLQSNTGWSRAIRALCSSLDSKGIPIAGADIHFSWKKMRVEFPWPLIEDHFLEDFAAPLGDVVVLHATTPDRYRRIANAINLGWFFWETDRLPLDEDWLETFESMDAVCVPSEWQIEIFKAYFPAQEFLLVPWPLTVEMNKTAKADEFTSMVDFSRNLRVHSYGKLEGEPTALPPDYFFALQSDVARKGLPALISEWSRFKQQTSSSASLVVKITSINHDLSPHDIMRRAEQIIRRTLRGNTQDLGILMTAQNLDDADLKRLFQNAKAFVSTTYGEGFGGAFVEAAEVGTNVIIPMHSGCAQLAPPDYAGLYPTTPYVGSLADQLGVYPSSSSWCLPVPGAVASRLAAFDRMDDKTRSKYAAELRSHQLSILDAATIAGRITSFVDDRLAGKPRRRRA